MTTQINFSLAATETVTVPSNNQSNTFALPPVDGSNGDLMISHTNSSPIFLNFGPGAVAVGNPQALGQITAFPGVTILTSNAAVLATGRQQVLGGPLVALAAGQTQVAVWSPGWTTVTFTRGTASATVTL